MTESSKPPSGRRMKARAPPPPQAPQPAPRHVFRNTVPDGGGTSGMDAKENILRPTVDLQLTLPDGYQTSVTEDGSKALMDLLVDLCSRYHLNPALHTLELLSPEGHTLGFKPNALLGSLNVACVIIKEKVWEEKVVRRPAPKVPEKTVRLMVNYHGSQKAVVRVNPLVPLQSLIPVICEKCEFDPAHVLLLKDSISRHELPLNNSLTELGIKELYVHDQNLVLQPKMASAPALNHSDSIHSSTTSLGRSEKKGFLGIFQFNRRKTKTEKTSMDMDDCDDKVIQHTDRKSNGLSTVSGFTSIEDRPSTLGQSQSVMNIQAKMSPKAETKKRRAPALPGAPTPSMVHTGLEGYQTSLGSESQQRKRKAPAPPPTPASITPGPDDTSTSAIPTPDSHTAETSSPSLHTKVVQSTTTSVTTVVMQTVKPVPSKKAAQPLPVSAATPTPSSPTPSSSTTDSLAVQDSSSELSHSLDDSDADPDQTGSQCSSLSSSTASGSVLVQTIKKSSSSRVEKSEKASSNTAAKSKHKESSDSSSNSETESALNLRLDEVENNRHSAMGTADQSVPPKPHRLPGPITPSSPSTDTTESNSLHSFMEEKEAASQSWLHSMRNSTANGPKPETGTPEEETMSLASSSSSSSHDQGYAASEGMIEGEDSGMVGSPSDTQPTSPDESLSADGSSRGGEGGLLGPVQDASSDSDEGCATWGSKYRHNDSSQQTKSGRLRNSYEDDTELSAQIDQTLADFEANLAEHTEKVSKKETSYAMSTRSNEVPVSVVDMDVPVTAIDEVLEDYERNIVETKAKSLTRSVSSGSTGPDFCNQSIIEPQNKNNNACTAADSNKISSANTKQTSQPQKHRKSLEIKSKVDKKKEMRLETKVKEMSISGTNSMKKDKQTTSAVKPTIDIQKHSKSTEIKSDHVKNAAQSFQEKELVLSPTSQRMVSTESHEEMHRVHQNNSSSNTLHGKITHNVTSRFGMRTFTVVPPKPTVVDTASMPAVTLTPGAIKIDDQGNMVKVGISHNKADDSSGLGINHAEGSPLVGQVKAFWSSNERQESAVTHNKGLIDKAKESTVSLKSTTTAISQSTFKGNTEDLKTPQSLLIKLADRAQSKEKVKEASEPVKDFKVSNEEWVDDGSSGLGINHAEGSPLVGQAKAFWSSNERQESAVTHNKGLIDKAKESTVSLKSTTTAISQSTFKGNTEDLKTPQSLLIKLAERAQSKEKVKEASEPVKDYKVSNEEWVDDGSSGLGINHAEGSPLVGQAKAFWSSNERQESAVTHNKGLIDKAKESTVSLKSTTTAISQSTFKGNTEDLKTPQSFFIKLAEEAQSKEKVKEAIEPVKDFKGSNEEWVDVESKSSVTRHIQQPSNKPTLPPYVLPEPRKDLSFLKPPRRTSSHYVASAISKYAPKISAKPSSSPNIPDSSFSLKSQIFQRSGQSVLVNPQQSSQSSLSDNKENGSALKSNLSGPMRSMSYPEYVSVSQRNFGEVRVDREDFGGYIGSIKGNSNTLETEAAKNRNIHSSSPTQKSLTANNERENIKHTRLRSPSPEQSSPLHSSAKPLTAPKPIFHGQTSNTKTMPKAATYLTSDAKPQPSVTETDSGVMPGPSQVTVFGPIKKFRPVILRSVEKETSLHSSLMDAIQTGGGRDRLKKITSSESNSLKKASYVEEENERSALLAAIRAQSTAARLRKTRSKAAYELEKSRKASEEERSADIPSSSSSSSSSSPSSPSSPSPPSLTLTSPPVFTPMPPPPPAPMIAPPPPPPVLPQGKPSNVAFPSTSEPMNPAMAREAMLEAIRSGAAAGRLRKVTVPIKTVKVNGRLGTIQATLP